MTAFDENDRMEYAALMTGGRDAGHTGQLCGVASGIAAAVLLSWGVAAKSAALMLPVMLAVAYGFYANLRARYHARLVAGYVEEYHEGRGGPQWFTRLRSARSLPGFSFAHDLVNTVLANAVMLAAVVFGWMFAPGALRGELMAGIVTGCGIVFAFHSFSETTRLHTTDFAASWRQASGELREEKRAARVAGS